jgi:hypothetical protein
VLSKSLWVVWSAGALGLDLSFVRYIYLMEPLADASLEQQVLRPVGLYLMTLLHQLKVWCGVHAEQCDIPVAAAFVSQRLHCMNV